MTPQEHPFAHYVRILGKGKTSSRSLQQREAYTAMQMILAGEVESVQLGAFLMLLRVKEETAEELTGFVEACREYISSHRSDAAESLPSNAIEIADLDWPSYAGKRKQPPWYLLSALLLAQNGYRIVMHGYSGHTEGRHYSEQVLQELGVPAAEGWQQCERQLRDSCFSYFPLQHFCLPLADIIELRRVFGLRSPVHTLVRLLNPAAAKASIQSVFHPSYMESHHQASLFLGSMHSAVFKGDGGEAEYRPHANVKVKYVRQGNGGEYSIQRKREAPPPTEINSRELIDIWRGEATNGYGVEAIVGTAAIALCAMNKAENHEAAYALAQQFWQQRNRNKWYERCE